MYAIPYVPTPYKVVRRMLELAQVKPDESVYDLGAGDGRVIICAAEEFAAKGVGIELYSHRIDKMRENTRRRGLGNAVYIIRGDLHRADLSSADVVTLYLLPETNRMLKAKLEQELRPNARIVSHDYPIQGWVPERFVRVKCDGDVHNIYLYRPPRKTRVS